MTNTLQNVMADVKRSISVRLTDARGNRYYINDSPLLLHSRELMQWLASNRLKIAAWITPDDPTVKALVAKATIHLAQEPMPAPNAMIGYANHASSRAVRDQVNAIYDTLRLDYHMIYTQARVPYAGPGDTSASLEYIKLPADVLQEHSGMCIELTALLAAAVEHIGLHAEIVIIPRSEERRVGKEFGSRWLQNDEIELMA